MSVAHDCVRIESGNGAIKPKPDKTKGQVNAVCGLEVRIRDEVCILEVGEEAARSESEVRGQ